MRKERCPGEVRILQEARAIHFPNRILPRQKAFLVDADAPTPQAPTAPVDPG